MRVTNSRDSHPVISHLKLEKRAAVCAAGPPSHFKTLPALNTHYEKTYATVLTNHDGSVARLFSSWDQSTTDLHFRWMGQYGIDGVFVHASHSGTTTT